MDPTPEFVTVLEHPAAARPEFLRIAGTLTALSILQIVWAALIFYASTSAAGPFADIPFSPGVVYSSYSGVHALYTLLGVLLSVLVRSRRWMRAAALACAVPGPGVLFGLVQVPVGVFLFRRLGQKRWEQFFQWHESIGRPRVGE